MPTLAWACWKATDIMELNNLIHLIAEDDGSGLYRFLPFIIIMILYSLSSLLKKKKQEKKQQKRPQPKTKSTRREETLPTYARPKPAPRTPQPAPSRRPTEPTPTPIEIIPEATYRRPQPIPVPSAQRKKPAKAPKAAAIAMEQAITRDRAKAKQQMLSTAEAGELRKTTLREKKSVLSTRQNVTADKLDLALGQKNVLVRAIIYAEILGKPIGLKPKGGYELE